MFRSLWNAVVEFLDTPICSVPDLYEFLDLSEGRLTSEEAFEIVLPTALESGFSHETEKAKVGCRKIWLAKDNKLNKVIWIFDFGLLEIDGDKDKAEGYFKGFGSIELDDETGEILGVFFSR